MSAPTTASPLARWLAWLDSLNPAAIELGLDRVRRVAERLEAARPRLPVITVAGTNGKGSVCAFLEAILLADGWRPGVYTSPHLARYNERVRVGGHEATDQELVDAFAAVESARGTEPLTFFEFGTLAALEHFRVAGADVLVLEVGLGGRLDATNVIDAAVAVVCSIGLDHAEWLGNDRLGVAREKAAVGRRGRPLICAESDPPAGWDALVAELGVDEWRVGRDYSAALADESGVWSWCGANGGIAGLPAPGLVGSCQRANAAAAIAALAALEGAVPRHAPTAAGVAQCRVPGRCEVFPGPVETILDVAHNPQAAASLALALHERRCIGRTWAVLGMFADKDVEAVTQCLAPLVDGWFCADLPAPRGLSGRAVAERAAAPPGGRVRLAGDPAAAWRAAVAVAAPGDRILVTGSFATVAPVRALFL